jgi:dihydroorotase
MELQRPVLLSSVTVAGARQISPDQQVLIHHGKIAQIGPRITNLPHGTLTLEAAGKILLPGLCDLQAHLRQPGREDCETLQSGTAAANRGGITALVMMPDTVPPVDNGGAVQGLLEASLRRAPVDAKKLFRPRADLRVAGCISKGGMGEELAELVDMHAAGAVFMTDEPHAVENPLLMRRALNYARSQGITIATRCDIKSLTAQGCMNEGAVSFRLGLPGMAACSEEICLARDLRLAQSVDSTIHINQISTALSVETVSRYKKHFGFSVGVSPHHLIFSEAVMLDGEFGCYNTDLKLHPPLRLEADRVELLRALRDASYGIDVIVTGHAPHTEFEKERDFFSAPFGATGLETSLVALYHYLIRKGEMDWPTLVRTFSENPRKLAKLPPADISEGQVANCVLFDPQSHTTFNKAELASMSKNTPFLDKMLQGQVQLVILGQEVVYQTLGQRFIE